MAAQRNRRADPSFFKVLLIGSEMAASWYSGSINLRIWHCRNNSSQSGVCQCRRGTDIIRIVVAGQVPKTKHNALLHLFSASTKVIGYGAGHYEQRSQNTSTLLEQLVAGYRKGISYVVHDGRFPARVREGAFQRFIASGAPGSASEPIPGRAARGFGLVAAGHPGGDCQILEEDEIGTFCQQRQVASEKLVPSDCLAEIGRRG
jgi:hypothetical protein